MASPSSRQRERACRPLLRGARGGRHGQIVLVADRTATERSAVSEKAEGRLLNTEGYMPITFGVFRNDGDDVDRGDGDIGDGGAFGGGAAIPGPAVNPLLTQALWHTRGDLTNGMLNPNESQFKSGMVPLPT